ncbi:hypothetical protein FS749_016093 [Ceratobasidium sp. UAMH 11750]|nr:hypothetical protein FS749_016093 [Ceratobasidium sp. UAMH 11750]
MVSKLAPVAADFPPSIAAIPSTQQNQSRNMGLRLSKTALVDYARLVPNCPLIQEQITRFRLQTHPDD